MTTDNGTNPILANLRDDIEAIQPSAFPEHSRAERTDRILSLLQERLGRFLELSQEIRSFAEPLNPQDERAIVEYDQLVVSLEMNPVLRDPLMRALHRRLVKTMYEHDRWDIPEKEALKIVRLLAPVLIAAAAASTSTPDIQDQRLATLFLALSALRGPDVAPPSTPSVG